MKRISLLRCCIAASLLVASTIAQALDQVDGVYQIGSLEDYKAFAELVNNGESSSNAVLTADIDLGEDATMIGVADKPYTGVFDGQGHVVSIAWKDAAYDCGLFQYMAGTVRNLHVTGTLQSVNQHPSTVVGRAHSRGGTFIENIYCDVEMTITKGYDTGGGGIMAFAQGDYKMQNVVFAGKMIGDNVTEHCGGFVGWSDGKGEIDNCLFVGEVSGMAFNNLNSFNYVSRGANASWTNFYYVPTGTTFVPGGVIEVTEDDVKSGALAFALNGYEEGGTKFFQTIGVDNAPVPFANGHGVVYCKADEWLCNGKPLGVAEYTNEPQVKSQPTHDMDEGFCLNCGTWDETYMTPAADGWYEVATGNQLAWWSVLTKKDRQANMRLTADIEMDETSNGRYVAPGTTAKPFCGHIDGQHHCISGLELSSSADPIGLVAVMNSELEAPKDATAARAADPAYIKNLRLDETCTVTGHTHVGGFIGQVREWAGNVLLEKVGMEGTVNGIEGSLNCGSLIGCVPGGDNSCTVNIRNCYTTGSVHGTREDGILAGYLGRFATVENYYAIGECDNARNDENYLSYPAANIKLKNVYSLYGTQGNVITEEEVNDGSLCVKLAGNNYDQLAWFQNVGDENYPVLDPTHAIVVKAGENISLIHEDAEVQDAVSNVLTATYEYLDEAMAEQRLIDDCRTLTQALSSTETKADFLPAYAKMLNMRDTVATSIKVYEAYVKKCDETNTYLDEHHDFVGPDRADLENYLTSNAEPGEDWPLGGYLYITQKHLAADSLINKEIARVDEMLNKAIAGGYQPGMDVTSILVNPDLSAGTKGWEGTFGTWNGLVEETRWYVGENNSTDSVDVHQTVTGLKPGYYKLTLNVTSKAGGNRYSYDQHAFVYANDDYVLIPAAREGMLPKDEAIDGVNTLITGTYLDQVIYSDGVSTEKTEDNDTIGYIPNGLAGMTCCLHSGRYISNIIAKVGEDGNLTIGMRRNASGGLFFQLLFGNVHLQYCGSEEDAFTATGIQEVLDEQLARANTLLTIYDPANTDQAPARNYPAVLKAQLEANVATAQAATTLAEKMAALKALTQTFAQIVDGKEAYYEMFKKADLVESISVQISTSLTDEENEAIYDALDAIYAAYNSGSMTTEEARKAEALNVDVINNLIPAQDENGIYHITSGRQMLSFATIANMNSRANAQVDVDIDMTGLAWTPIGTKANNYRGTFDGRGHRFSNFEISGTTDYFGVFGYVTDGAVIRNFVLDNTCSISGASYAGVIGGNTTKGKIVVESVGMEGNVTGSGTNVGGIYGTNMGSAANLYVTNCYVTGAVTGGRESAAICGWGGGKVGVFTNCWTISDVTGFYLQDGKDYLIRNLNTIMKHVLSTKGAQGTIITEEQLASGEACYILNDGNTISPKWFQNLGKDPWPVLDPTHGVVGMKADSTYTNEPGEWLNVPELMLDVVFNEDGTAQDASEMHMTVDSIGLPTVYYNEELKRNVVRLDNEWGTAPATFYKVNFENNMLFRGGLENGHTLEMLLMPDFGDSETMPDVVSKPFSAMQAGGTGFELAALDGVRQFRFNANASPLYISSWARCDSKAVPEAGKFMHVVGVWDKEEGKAHIYVNGELQATTDLPGNVVYANPGCSWFGIGGDPANATKASDAWRGEIAIARVYSKAITADQVKDLFKGTGTGIASTVVDTPVKATGIYTINGIRVQKTDKGLYIINGKKVMVK